MRKTWTHIRRSWRTFWEANHTLKRALYPLVWLPTGIVFTELFYTVKIVSGRSMQVSFPVLLGQVLSQMHQLASQHLTQIHLHGGTWSYSTVSQSERCVSMSGGMWLR